MLFVPNKILREHTQYLEISQNYYFSWAAHPYFKIFSLIIGLRTGEPEGQMA